MQNVVGPTFVAMAPTFGLGAEIQSPTGMSVCLSVTNFKLLLFLFLDGIEPFLAVSSPLQNFFSDFYRATQSARS